MRSWTASEHTLASHVDQRQHARYGFQNVTAPSVHAAIRQFGKSYSSVRLIERLLTLNTA
ncbi:hypothetical protein D3C72_2434500 [compost metagenome]